MAYVIHENNQTIFIPKAIHALNESYFDDSYSIPSNSNKMELEDENSTSNSNSNKMELEDENYTFFQSKIIFKQ